MNILGCSKIWTPQKTKFFLKKKIKKMPWGYLNDQHFFLFKKVIMFYNKSALRYEVAVSDL